MARAQRSAFGQGSCPGRGRSTVGVLRWSRLEAGVTDGYFLLHALRPLNEALIRMAEQLVSSGGSCRSVVEAA
jgi:hypothetical protein